MEFREIVTSLLFKCPPGQTNLARRQADGLTDSHEKVKSKVQFTVRCDRSDLFQQCVATGQREMASNQSIESSAQICVRTSS